MIYNIIYIWFSVGQPPPMGMGVQSCFLWFPPPPVACGGGVFWMLVMGGDVWMYGCMDVWMDVCMDGWMDLSGNLI